jgi:hypothetical protein
MDISSPAISLFAVSLLYEPSLFSPLELSLLASSLSLC